MTRKPIAISFVVSALAACGTEPHPSVDAAAPAVGQLAVLALDKLAPLSAVKANGDSLPRGFTVLGDSVLYFSAIQKGLWKTDGTPQGTVLIRDLAPTLDSFQATPHIVTLGNRAYWMQARALWSTDGTPESVSQVITFPASENLTPPVVYDGAIYFGTSTQLYKSDGTAAGTQILTAARVISGESTYWQGFHVMGDKLYFPCEIAGSGVEPCVTDGTAAGTRVIKDLRPGGASSSPHLMGHLGNKLLFSAQVPASLNGLWVTDGTDAGTLQLVGPAVNSDAIQTSEDDFVVLGANAYIPCFTSATGFELCKTDGTVAGTSVIETVAGTTSGSPSGLAVLGNHIFYTATTATAGRELWSTDGTPAGTALFIDIVAGANDGASYGDKITVGNTLYFTARTAIGASTELWKTDGTVGGTVEVKHILPAGSPPRYAVALGAVLGTKLVFTADDGVHGLEPWITDGTAAQTVLLKDMTPDTSGAEVFEAAAFGSSSYLAVSDSMIGQSVWQSDGTTAGTKLFHQAAGHGFTVLGSQLLYATPGNASALWATDGTTPTKIKDLPGSASEFVTANHKLAFTGTTPSQTAGLWISDGTGAGTALANPSVTNARRLGVANDRFWLTGLQGTAGNELWSSDGVTSTAVKDIRSGGASSEPSNFAGVGGLTVFAATDGATGSELWRTDGTFGGTTLLADIRPGGVGSGPFGMFSFKNMVLFWAASATTYELWKTDGTFAGTTMLQPIASGGDRAFVVWGDHAYFAATDPASGVELWRTDGTAAGTVLVADIYAGPLPSNPTNLILATPTGPLFFAAEDPKSGRELWRLDTELGTPTLAADIVPGPQSSRPSFSTIAGLMLLLVADDGSGNAVYGVKVADAVEPDNDGSPGGDGGTDPMPSEGAGCCSSTNHDLPEAVPFLLVALLLGRRRRR